jgi:hypothetical protein
VNRNGAANGRRFNPVNGWPSVALIIAAEVVVAGLFIRAAVRRWWHYLAIAILTATLVGPTEHHVTGDVSRYLPDALWSDGSDKDQIIYLSAASTVLLPLIASAFAVVVFNRIWRALLTTDRRDGA